MRRRSIIGSVAVVSSPPTVRVPCDGSDSRLISRSRVVLPDPDGPTIAMNSPAATSSENSTSAGRPSPKVLLTALNEIAAAILLGYHGHGRAPSGGGEVFGCVSHGPDDALA